jgi:D-3-phosphoglycerate dehydrogenase
VAVLATDEEGEMLVDATFLQNLPAGAYLVHVGNPAAVDEAALAEAIEQRHLRVALDVRSSEPATDSARFRCRLCDRPGVIGTQHIGSLTAQARQAVAEEVVRIIRLFMVSGEVTNCLNLCDRSPATWQLVLRLRDQVGVMAAVLDSIRADGVNAQEISSRVFTGAKAAWCAISLDERPSTEALESIRALPDVLHLELRAVV